MEGNNNSTVETNKKEKTEKKFKVRYIIVLLLLVIFLASTGISFRANYLENLEIGKNYATVYLTKIKNEYMVFGVAFIATFIFILINNGFIKKGIKQFFKAENKEMPKFPNKTFAFALALLSGIVAKSMLADKLLIFKNSAVFGYGDPIFNVDIGYYLFSLPFIHNLLLFLAGILVVTIAYIGIYYVIVLNNNFDGVDVELLKKNTFAKHEVFLAFVLVIIIVGYIFINSQNILTGNMLDINDADETYLIGASTSDVTVKLWGYRLLSVIVLFVAIRFVRFIKKGNFKQAMISLAIIPAYLVVMFVVLIGFNIATIGKNELDNERKYIAYNINNTKEAYGIDIDQVNINNYEAISSSDIENNEEVIDNIPIITEAVNLTTIAEHQENSVYYSYDNTFLAMYDVNGSDELLYITPREIINDNTISYNSKTLRYTHGYSLVAMSATDVDVNGYAKYVLSDFTSEDILGINEPRIYFGLETDSIIRTNTSFGSEYDYPTSASTYEENVYDGRAGLNVGFLDKLALGLYERNFRLIFANDYLSETKVITNRNIIERAKKVFSDILYDEDPYLVITDEGRLVWVLDGYTRTNSYPYSQMSKINLNGYKETINYIRNSVKVLIDAYDGTTTFYIVDKTDPIIMTYWKMYPELFTDESLPESVIKHLVYPKFLYDIQADMLNIYHDINEDTLYRADDIWQITPKAVTKTASNLAMDPYYIVLKNTNQKQSELGLFVTYNKYGKQNITSYLVGAVNEKGKSSLSLYKYNSESNIVGIAQLNNQIEQDETISDQLDAINTSGTKLIKDMIIIPIDNSLLYIEPVYQVMLNESEIPILKKVIVASGSTVAIGDTLETALQNLFSDELAVDLNIYNTDDIDAIIDSIIRANNNFKDSQQSGDFEIMGRDFKTLESLLNQLENARRLELELKNEQLLEESNDINNIAETNQINNVLNNEIVNSIN